MRFPLCLLLIISSTLCQAAPKPRHWQTGTLAPIQLVYVDRTGGPYFHTEGTHSFDIATIPLVIVSGQFLYRASERAATTVHVIATNAASEVALERSADAASVVPWTAHLPNTIQFAIQGKALYYLDGRSKEHKAKLLSVVPVTQ